MIAETPQNGDLLAVFHLIPTGATTGRHCLEVYVRNNYLHYVLNGGGYALSNICTTDYDKPRFVRCFTGAELVKMVAAWIDSPKHFAKVQRIDSPWVAQ